MKKYGKMKGYRAGMYDSLLDPSRTVYPRRLKEPHSREWYTDGHLASRPVIGLYSLARYAEHLLYLSKCRTSSGALRMTHEGIVETAKFHAEAIRMLQLSKYEVKAGAELSKAALETLRNRVLRLCKSLAVSINAIELASERQMCPVCKSHAIPVVEAEMIEEFLRLHSANGDIPRYSPLYRGPLTPATVM